MKDIVIIGAGGFGREVAWLIERINARHKTWNLIGFLDDNPDLHGKVFDNYPVLGSCECLTKNNVWVVCAVGSSKIRKKIIDKIQRIQPVKFATLIDPDAIISDRVSIGQGSIICAGTIITVDVQIGSHVLVNLNCTLGHDDIIGDYVTLYPGVNVSGMVQIGVCSEIGTGTQIRQKIIIGDDIVVGASAAVVKNIDIPGTYVGVPAMLVKPNPLRGGGNSRHLFCFLSPLQFYGTGEQKGKIGLYASCADLRTQRHFML